MRDTLLVLVPGFSFLSLGCILEPLRYAQALTSGGKAKVEVYDLAGGSSQSQAGFTLCGAGTLAELETRLLGKANADAIFFCCGFDVEKDVREPLRRLMRLARRCGIPIYGLGAATWALAETDLLPNRIGVVHWSSLSAFKERNLDITPLPKLYCPDPKVTTCAGELATLDLIVHFVIQTFGKPIADQMCDRFLIARPRGPETDQPQHTASLLRYAPPLLHAVVSRMTKNLEHPLRVDSLAAEAGVSQRQLERLFARYLGASPRKFYHQLQLALAWQLCEQTDLTLTEIAFASGFSTVSGLSRKFRDGYQISPSELRARSRGRKTAHPER